MATQLMLYKELHSEHKEKFESLLTIGKRSGVGFDIIYSALESYKTNHGDLMVPRRFVVPQDDDRYPIESWGLKLGVRLHDIRSNSTFSRQRTKLEELGVNFEVEKKHRWDFLTQIDPALEAYKTVNGDYLFTCLFCAKLKCFVWYFDRL